MKCVICKKLARAKCCSAQCLAEARKLGLLPPFPRPIRNYVLDNKVTHPKYLCKEKDRLHFEAIGKLWVSTSSNWQHFMFLCSIDTCDVHIRCHCTKPVKLILWNITKGRNCSYKCSANNPLTMCKRKETNLQRHGVENVSSLSSVKQKKVNTCRSNFGVDHPQQSVEVRAKTVEVVKDLYGVDNVSRSKIFKKARENTMIRRYGAPNIRQTSYFRDKFKATSQARFGTDHPMANNEVKAKCMDSATRSENGLRPALAKYITVGNKEFKLRGFEDLGLKWLLETYDVSQIHNTSKDMPCFMYKESGKERRYFPDFYVREHDGSLTIVEVKSTFTLGTRANNSCMFKNLIRKAKAVNKQGLKFIVLVFNTKHSLAFYSTSFHKATKRHFLLFRNCERQHGRLSLDLL